MKLAFAKNYAVLSDREIVDIVITHPYDEDAATYLIRERYQPLLKKVYRKVFDDDPSWYDDCLQDLFIYLKGREMDWNKLRSFKWKSKFSTWINKTAYNRFLDIKPNLTGNYVCVEPPENNDLGGEEYEVLERKIMLMEAISQLKDLDEKFVVLKELQGFNNQEIAKLMILLWKKHGIKKYDNKGNLVIPSVQYVYLKRSRAKEHIKEIIKKNYY